MKSKKRSRPRSKYLVAIIVVVVIIAIGCLFFARSVVSGKNGLAAVGATQPTFKNVTIDGVPAGGNWTPGAWQTVRWDGSAFASSSLVSIHICNLSGSHCWALRNSARSEKSPNDGSESVQMPSSAQITGILPTEQYYARVLTPGKVVTAGKSGNFWVKTTTARLLGYLGIGDLTGGSLIVSGNYAYVLVQRKGLYIINIINYSQPILSSFLSVPLATTQQFVLNGGHIYFEENDGNGKALLDIVNVSNPLAPKIVSTYTTQAPGYITEITAKGAYLYVSVSGSSKSGLEVVNISDPSKPVKEKVYSEIYCSNLLPYNSYLLGSCFQQGSEYLYIMNLANSTSTMITGKVLLSSNSGVDQTGSLVLGTDYVVSVGGMYPIKHKIVSISTITNPQIIKTLESYPTKYSLLRDLSGGLFFFNDLYSYTIANFMDMNNPKIKGTIPVDFLQDIRVINNTAFVLSQNKNRFEIYDISDFLK